MTEQDRKIEDLDSRLRALKIKLDAITKLLTMADDYLILTKNRLDKDEVKDES